MVQGRHKGTGEPVAIKIIRRRGMDKKQLKVRCTRATLDVLTPHGSPPVCEWWA